MTQNNKMNAKRSDEAYQAGAKELAFQTECTCECWEQDPAWDDCECLRTVRCVTTTVDSVTILEGKHL